MSENRRVSTLQFAVCITANKAVVIGRTSIIQPMPKFNGGSIKWFDDKKLMRGGDVK